MSKHHKVIIIAGISGVGKSHVVSTLRERNSDLIHFSAGTLIKKRVASLDRDELRKLGDNEILKNQYLLIDQFNEELASLKDGQKILFDAHMIIDAENDVVEIPFEIFELLKPCALIFLKEEPSIIFNRRNSDESRKRPMRSVEVLTKHQARSLSMAEEYSCKLDVLFQELSPSNIEALEALVNDL